jgi:hypothetical protein
MLDVFVPVVSPVGQGHRPQAPRLWLSPSDALVVYGSFLNSISRFSTKVLRLAFWCQGRVIVPTKPGGSKYEAQHRPVSRIEKQKQISSAGPIWKPAYRPPYPKLKLTKACRWLPARLVIAGRRGGGPQNSRPPGARMHTSQNICGFQNLRRYRLTEARPRNASQSIRHCSKAGRVWPCTPEHRICISARSASVYSSFRKATPLRRHPDLP